MPALVSISDECRAMLEESEKRVDQIEDEGDEAVVKAQNADAETLQELFVKRQPLLDAVEGFWGSALGCAASPVKEFLNTTCDPKILRAISSLAVTRSSIPAVENGEEVRVKRRVTIKLRPNPFIETTELFREIDDELETLAISNITWKPNTERMRNDSLFHKMFDEKAKVKHEEPVNFLDAFDEVFANPLILLEESKQQQSQ